jgi:hypothetical protein
MGYVGWGTVVDQCNTETGGAIGVVADVSAAVDTGLSVGGAGVINTYSGAPSPVPPTVLGYILLQAGIEEYLLQQSGSPPTRIQLE